MELAFGQYASLGPITIWKAVPLFKGIPDHFQKHLFYYSRFNINLKCILLSVWYLSVFSFIYISYTTDLVVKFSFGYCAEK